MACSSNEGYQVLPNGAKWQLLAFEDRGEIGDSAALIYLDVVIRRSPSDSILESMYNEAFAPTEDALWEFLLSRNLGDSLVYSSISSDFLRPIHDFDTLTYNIYISRFRTEQDLQSARIKELRELSILAEADSVKSNYHEKDGVYIRLIREGDTVAVAKGKELVMHYIGKTIAGKVFDDSHRMDGPLRFIYGNENQVLPGIEIALSSMHRLEKTRVLIPSWLAFGSKGSGVHVLPYTTVIYDLEITDLAN